MAGSRCKRGAYPRPRKCLGSVWEASRKCLGSVFGAYCLNTRSEENCIRNTSILGASFGIRILEYVWNTVGILRIRAEYSPFGGRLEYVEYVFTQ